LSELDIILMRKDPPVDLQYLHTTQLLDLAIKQGCQVINRPQSLRDFNEKLLAQHFVDDTPPTLISYRLPQLHAFIQTQQMAVLKPLDGMGGQGIFKLSANDPNINTVLEILTNNGTTLAVAQKYLRVIVIFAIKLALF